MRHITFDRLAIAFGNARTSFEPRQFVGVPDQQALLRVPELQLHLHTLGFSQLLVLEQIHSFTGYAFVSPQACSSYRPYSWQGDYLATSVPGVGLAVATADCLSLVLYDPTHQAVSVVHAGWRGSVDSIAVAALQQMQAVFGTVPADVHVFFGPAARVCCYEVQEEVANELFDWAAQACIENRSERLFLNVPLLNELQLVRAGVQEKHVRWDACDCTICTPGYCSWRRDNSAAQRQMTIAMVRSTP